jgi:MFS family permease
MRSRRRRSAAAPEALRRQLGAVRLVFSSRSLRDCQLALVLVRTSDLAQLVAVSAFLYLHGGFGDVAAYGVVRAIVPALGVPIVASATRRHGRGRVLRLLAFTAALASSGVVVVLAAGGPVPIILALATVIGVAIGSFRPITSALVPSLVSRPEQLVACTASAGFLDGATTVCGPLLAGALLGVAGPAWAVGATVLLLVIAGLFGGRLPAPARLVLDSDAQTPPGAFRTLVRVPEAATVGGLGLCQTFVRGALNVIVVVFVIDTMRLGEGVIGLLLGAIGVGGMLAFPAALAIVGSRRLYRSFGLGLALWGAPLAVAAGLPHLPVALVFFAVVGAGNVLIDISAFSAIPRAVPDRALAGVFGLLEALFQIGLALGAVAAGVLLELFGARGALLVVGLLLPAAALLAAPLLRRFDVRLGHHDVEVELLRRQPLFANLPMPVLDGLGARLAPAAFDPGELIMSEGDHGDRYVLIVDGTVTFTQHGALVNVLHAGSAFGEIALVRDLPRTATATATTPVAARTLDQEAFLAALGCDPQARATAEAVADEHLARASATDRRRARDSTNGRT